MTLWVSALGLLGLLAGGAGQDQILWSKTWEAALGDAETRNVPIFITVLKDGCAGSMVVREETLKDRTLVAYLNEVAVPLVGHTADVASAHEPEQYEDPETGKPAQRCPLYKVITCTEHDTIFSRAQDVLGVKETPKSFVLGPRGKPLEGSGEVKGGEPGDIVLALRRVQKKLGKPLSRTIYYGALGQLDRGRAAFEAKEFPKAIRLLQGLSGNRKAPKKMREEADGVLSKVNEMGFVLLGAAQETLKESPEEGRRLLKQMVRDFRGLEAGKAAKRALTDARKRSKGGGGKG